MKINVDEHGTIVVTEVYNPTVLKTDAGEEFTIVMRDSGFEFSYGDVHYEAKRGHVKQVQSYKIGAAPRTLFFDDVIKMFNQQTFGSGYPITPIETWHDDHQLMFWDYVS
jgi:hypothetical protein